MFKCLVYKGGDPLASEGREDVDLANDDQLILLLKILREVFEVRLIQDIHKDVQCFPIIIELAPLFVWKYSVAPVICEDKTSTDLMTLFIFNQNPSSLIQLVLSYFIMTDQNVFLLKLEKCNGWVLHHCIYFLIVILLQFFIGIWISRN